jgi:hypothetical protein
MNGIPHHAALTKTAIQCLVNKFRPQRIIIFGKAFAFPKLSRHHRRMGHAMFVLGNGAHQGVFS